MTQNTVEKIAEVHGLVELGHDLNTQQAAILLTLSPRTLEKYRITGEGPHFYRYGRAVRYSINDLMAWKNARRHSSTSEESNYERK